MCLIPRSPKPRITYNLGPACRHENTQQHTATTTDSSHSIKVMIVVLIVVVTKHCNIIIERTLTNQQRKSKHKKHGITAMGNKHSLLKSSHKLLNSLKASRSCFDVHSGAQTSSAAGKGGVFQGSVKGSLRGLSG